MTTSTLRRLAALIVLPVSFLPTVAPVSANPGLALDQAKSLGILRGVVNAEVIRPDLLLVTVDGGLVPGSAMFKDRPELGVTAAQIQKREAFSVSAPGVEGFDAGVQPAAVHRSTREWFNTKNADGMWALVSQGPLVQHDFYLKLPKALVSGHEYTVRVLSDGVPSEAAREIKLSYDAASTPTRAIKVNQVGYSASAGERHAYLGWWTGDGGPVDFDDFKTFQVVRDGSDEVVLEGPIVSRRRDHKLSGEHVYEMDLSKLGPGAYRIRISGFATSDPFTVGGAPVFDTFYQVARGFLHQRSGQALKEPWTAFTRPAAFLEVWESGHQVQGEGAVEPVGRKVEDIQGEPGKRVHIDHWKPVAYTPYAGEEKRSFPGGYFDAADYDNFTYHLPATCQVLSVYELYPEAFKDGQLDLPESGNGIPDVLDEALWAIRLYRDLQLPSGAVPLGRINLSDSRHQQIEGGKTAPMPAFGIIPPGLDSTPTYAAAAAQIARLIRPYDAKKADDLLASAEKAFAYAKDRTVEQIHAEHTTKDVPLILSKNPKGEVRGEDLFRSRLVWAAAELLRATGKPEYNEYVANNQKDANYWDNFELAMWAYTQADPAKADPALQKKFAADLLEKAPWSARKKVEALQAGGYRMSNGDSKAIGWGRAQGIDHNPTLIFAHALTGDQAFLDAVALNADWHGGGNPISQTFLTSMGVRHPNRPEINHYLYGDRTPDELFGNAVMGIPIYGFGPPVKTHPGNPDDKENNPWPLWRSWRDLWSNFAEIYSEFTVHQTIGPAAMTYAFLYANDLKNGKVPADAKPLHPLGLRQPLNVREGDAAAP